MLTLPGCHQPHNLVTATISHANDADRESAHYIRRRSAATPTDQGSSIGNEPTMMLHMPAIAGRLAMLVSLAAPSVASDTYPKNPGIDALNYAFRIELSDTTDAIVGEMTLDLRFLAPNVRSVRLDLAKADAAHGGKGMQVSAVTMDGAGVSFTHGDGLAVPT